MSRAKLTICLLSLLVLALAGAPATADDPGCCQLTNRCYQTDDADACKAAGGHHYQLAPCKDNKCEPTAAGGPIDGTAGKLALSLFAEPPVCPVATQGR